MFGVLRCFCHHHVETCSRVLGTKQPGCDTSDLCVGPEVKKDWSCAIIRKSVTKNSDHTGGCSASYVPYSIHRIQTFLLFQIWAFAKSDRQWERHPVLWRRGGGFSTSLDAGCDWCCSHEGISLYACQCHQV